MTKEELKKEAEKKGREWERSILPENEEDYMVYAPHYPYSQGYLAGAEPREKRIAELEKENAELKEQIGNEKKNERHEQDRLGERQLYPLGTFMGS